MRPCATPMGQREKLLVYERYEVARRALDADIMAYREI